MLLKSIFSTGVESASEQPIRVVLVYFFILKNFSGGRAELYVNGEDTGFTVVQAQDGFGPVAVNGTIRMHIEKDFPWGRRVGPYQNIPVRKLLDRVSITFIPMANPDGVQICQYGPTPEQRYFFNSMGKHTPEVV